MNGQVLLGKTLRRMVPVAIGCAIFAGVVAGCGSSGDSSTSDTSPSTQASGGTSTQASGASGSDRPAWLQEVDQKVAGLYKGESFHSPPTTGPKPQPGRKIWIVHSGEASASGSAEGKAAAEAAKALGWDVTYFDGKYQSNVQADGIRKAVAAGADGIVLLFIDCAPVRAALQEAHRAGVVIVANGSKDCDPPLLDATVQYYNGGYEEYLRAWGAAMADYLIAKTDGKAKTIDIVETDLSSTLAVDEGFKQEFAKCPTCEIVKTVEMTAADLGPGVQQKLAQALLQTPDANSIMFPYDDVATSGGAAALMASGRAKDMVTVSASGTPAAIAMVREGKGLTGDLGTSVEWAGYASIDNLNRAFHDQKPENSGIGMQLFDQEQNLPETNKVFDFPAIDWKSIYRKAWGVQ